MDDAVMSFLDENDGVATVAEIAELTGEDEGFVRRWARQHDVRRAGTTFIFTPDSAQELLESLQADVDDEEDDELEDETSEDEEE